jgi:hypothetical protein
VTPRASAQEQKPGRGEEDDEARPVVEPESEEVVGVVDAQGFEPATSDGVGGDVEGEQPAVA